MVSKSSFSQFSKQSKKGIIIIYLDILYKIIKALWVLVFVFIQNFSKTLDNNLSYIYFYLGFFFIFLLLIAFLKYHYFQFKIENNYFILKKGIIKKTNTSIPFDRIQNINFKQNIIQQIINVYEVNIETAGSSKAEISIKALSYEQANALKKTITINDKCNNYIWELDDDNKPNTINNPEIFVEQKPLLKISAMQLLKVSLTENHLKSLLLLLAILFGFYQQITELFNGFGEGELLDNYISENTTNFETNIVLIFILGLLFILVSVISSFVRVFLRHFNLTVYIKNNALEIYQGLTTKKSFILKKEKVQHITVSDNPIKRQLGISFITFKQALSGNVKKKQDKIIKLVGCGQDQVLAIKNLLFSNEKFENFTKNYSSYYFKVRLYLRSIIFLIIINSVLYFIFKYNFVFWINILLLPIFIISIELTFKKRFYLFTNDTLLIGSGTIETHKTYLPFYKVQNVKLKQTFFQSTQNIIDIVFQTASGKIVIPCIREDEAFKIYNYTLFMVENNKYSWM